MGTDPRGTTPTPAAAANWPGVSVVMPVLNEERHLEHAVDQVLGQDYPGPLEVLIALGPSRDRTADVAAALGAADSRVRTVPNPTGRTPAGLNAAVAASSYPVVARVDGHGLLAPGYLRAAVTLLEETGAANVGGIMAAEGSTPFEDAVACAMTSRLGVGSARFHTGGPAGPADTVYLGVFRRDVLERLGGYDESFVRAQDWELNHRIRDAGELVWFSPDLFVTYRPRRSPRALARQYFDYGRWRRVVMRRHPGSATARYLAPPAALLAVAGGTVLGSLGIRAGWLAPAGYAAGVLGGSLWIGRRLEPRARAWLPAVIITMHGSWAAGFLSSPRGLVQSAGEPV
jgi:succinoglycan biosynthesis protein ExoA